jgi:hypothetical protein
MIHTADLAEILVFIFHVIRHTLQMPNLNSIPSQDEAKQCFYNFYYSFKPALVKYVDMYP